MRAENTAATRSVTALLAALREGDRDAESELASLVYSELRRLAAMFMRRERGNHTLQPTALVNEAWERLAARPDAVVWQNRAHFFAVASQHMRQILVDYARKHNASKRGGARQQVTLDDQVLRDQRNLIDLLALNEAMERLKMLDPRACRIVELHFFGGLSFDEIALVVGTSSRTVERDWSMARAWLKKELARVS